MTSIAKIVKELEQAWNAHDVEQVVSFYSEDGIHENVPTGEVFKGRKAVRGYIQAMLAAFPDLKFEVKSTLVSGNMSAGELVMSGTNTGRPPSGAPATGKTFTLRFANVQEYEAGLIKRVSNYYDSAALYKQLGVLPAPPEDHKAKFRRAVEEE
jgi:steroid delta-isomerase-like uncharacterized protein